MDDYEFLELNDVEPFEEPAENEVELVMEETVESDDKPFEKTAESAVDLITNEITTPPDEEIKALRAQIEMQLSAQTITGGAEDVAQATLYTNAQTADPNNALVQEYLAEISKHLDDNA